MYILNIEYMKSGSGIYQWPTRSVTSLQQIGYCNTQQEGKNATINIYFSSRISNPQFDGLE